MCESTKDKIRNGYQRALEIGMVNIVADLVLKFPWLLEEGE